MGLIWGLGEEFGGYGFMKFGNKFGVVPDFKKSFVLKNNVLIFLKNIDNF